MGYSGGVISKYRRQLTEADLRPGFTYLGPDVEASWDADKIYFAAKWQDADAPPTSFQAHGAAGDSISANLALVPRNPMSFEIHDWDEALRTSIHGWKYNRTVIRWFCPWQHAMVGKITQIRMPRPFKNLLVVTMNVSSSFYYNVRVTQIALNTEAFLPVGNQLLDGFRYGPQMVAP